MQIFISIVLLAIIGTATAYIASNRGRDPVIWFAIGALLGIFGLLLVLLLPPVQQEKLPGEASVEAETTEPERMHEYVIKDWFYLDPENNQQGPVAFDVLKKLWKEGKLDTESYVWAEGMEEWKKIGQMQEMNQEMQLCEWRED